MLTPPPSARPQSKRAFTLVEITIAISIIAILAALAIPHYKRTKESAAISALENDLRIFKQAFDTHLLETEKYPPSQPIVGQFPVGMQGHMAASWRAPSPIGGLYRWVYRPKTNDTPESGYIEIRATTSNQIQLSTARLMGVDEDLDDGDLSTGRFQLVGLSIHYYVLK